MLTVRGIRRIDGLTLRQLRELPTLCEGQADNLKIETKNRQVWLSRCGVADGEPFENKVTVERLVKGNWIDVAIYEMRESKPNKWLYLWVVQQYTDQGWEDVCADEVYRMARANLREYQENQPGYSHRLIKRRELNQDYVKES